MSATIVQLTDLHLFTDREQQHSGITTWDTFEQVLAQVDQRHPDYDALILTGDLAQDEAAPTYAALRKHLGERITRCRFIPGNHDDRAYLGAAFHDRFEQRYEDGADTLRFIEDHGGWRIIGVDSQIPGEIPGHIVGEQLAWLETELRNAGDMPVLLFIHHPPLPVDDAGWFGEVGFVDEAPFFEVLGNAPNVKILCAGHVHQDYTGKIGDIDFFTTPSTSVQFGEATDTEKVPGRAGYRVFELTESGFSTEVFRLDGSRKRTEFAIPRPMLT
jgi:Icc protein